ncbi:MAG TPA: hypothetical protein ENI76_01710 [Ignavibacteria bacterium]|nr:hypothetical protein [Ignavibacteria bacterium]
MRNKIEMKNNALLLGVIFGIIMAIGLISINSILAAHINLKIVISGVIGATIGGLIFGVIMKYNFKIGNKIQIELQEGENILKEGPANHKVKYESVGGKLFLTTKRLVFKSHKINIQKHIFELELNKINDCNKYKTMGIIPNGLKISTNNNITEKFVVNRPNEWITHIEQINNTTQQQGIAHAANHGSIES